MQEAASPAGLSSVQRMVTLGRQQAGRGESLGRVARAPTRDTGPERRAPGSAVLASPGLGPFANLHGNRRMPGGKGCKRKT